MKSEEIREISRLKNALRFMARGAMKQGYCDCWEIDCPVLAKTGRTCFQERKTACATYIIAYAIREGNKRRRA